MGEDLEFLKGSPALWSELLISYSVSVRCEKCTTEKFCSLVFFNWKHRGYRISVAEHLGPARPTSVALDCCLGTTWGVQAVRYPNFFLGNGSR